MSNPYTRALDPKEATREIRRIAKNGSVATTRHCRQESMLARNIHYQDLLSVLQNGTVRTDPVYDEEHETYKYRVEGSTIDGDNVVAITVLLNHRSVLVITVF